MPAPNFGRSPGSARSASGRRGRRPLGLLVAACLVVAGAAVGTTVALAGRDSSPAAAAGSGSVASAPGKGRDGETTSADTARGSAVLPDGVHHTLIRKVEVARDRITVDVVQLFLDADAVKAATADGRSRQQAQYLTVYLRNQNPRLRTVPLAADLEVDFYQSCDEQPDRRAVLERLAGNVRLGVYFYTLTVRDGAVHTVKERQIQPAC